METTFKCVMVCSGNHMMQHIVPCKIAHSAGVRERCPKYHAVLYYPQSHIG